MAGLIPDPTLDRVLGSIDANNLVILSGAGLSMPSPSDLLSAVAVARHCYDKYRPIQELPVAFRDDIAALAGHFYATGEFQSVFLRRLVPWNELVGEPNRGHQALGDLLACRSIAAALTTNFDVMIEQWAKGLKLAMRGAVSAMEVPAVTGLSAPLLKLHGCLDRTREDTLWAVEQLAEAAVQQRLTQWAQWIQLNLAGKDLLVVGFWSDWRYLNAAVNGVLTGHGLASVTVVDPLPTTALASRAPDLWATLQNAAIFEHVQGSSDLALEEIRVAFSRVWLRKFLSLGQPLINAARGGCPPSSLQPPTASAPVLYNMRQDAEGAPYHRIATSPEPLQTAAQVAYAHLLLARAGAVRHDAWYVSGGRTVRIVNGVGQLLSTVQERYVEPPAVLQSDVVVCAGSVDLGVPSRLIAAGRGASTVRPAAGGGARWMTLDAAEVEFGL